MPDCFAIFYENKILVILTGLYVPLPLPNNVLDWYANNYAFERNKLTGCYCQSISVAEMKYEDFHACGV